MSGPLGERSYELDREGEAFVTGNPRRDDQMNPEVANDISPTGLSGETAEMDDILLESEASAELDTDLAADDSEKRQVHHSVVQPPRGHDPSGSSRVR